MAYRTHEREITKEEYEKIKNREMNKYNLFSESAVMGYGLIAYEPFERDGKYFISFSMSDCCD